MKENAIKHRFTKEERGAVDITSTQDFEDNLKKLKSISEKQPMEIPRINVKSKPYINRSSAPVQLL